MLARIPSRFETITDRVLELYRQGRYREAIGLAEEARDLTIRDTWAEHPDFATCLNNLAVLYEAIGNYVDAEPLMRRAMEIRRIVLGPNHHEFATSLNSLGILYRKMGKFREAETIYREALKIRRDVFGEDHPSFAINLNNLAFLFEFMGKYAAAKPLYQRAIAIYQATLEKRDPNIVATLSNLARLYRAIGNFQESETLFLKVMAIRRETIGEFHPDFASSLNNLAVLYELINRYDEAEDLYRQALEIRRKSLGEEHPEFADSLINLARLYRSAAKNRYAEAQSLIEKAIALLSKAVGERHPVFAASLSNLAELCRGSGRYEEAERLYHRVLNIRLEALGEEHSDFAETLYHLASLNAAQDRPTEALALMERAAAIDGRMIGQIFSAGSESDRLSYLRSIHRNLSLFLSLVLNHLADSATAVQAALDIVLRRKAIGAEALAAQRDTVFGGKYPELKAKLHELSILRMQIAQKILAGPDSQGLSFHQQLLAEWKTRKEELESELALKIPEMNLEKKLSTVSRRVVAMTLPEESALLEFVRVEIYDFKAIPAEGEKQWKPAHYVAFVLLHGEPDDVQLIDLGEAEPIDQMIVAFRESINREGESRSGQRMEAISDRPSQTEPVNNKWKLWATLFQPLLPALKNRKRLFLALDGNLMQMPFEVLLDIDGNRLIENYNISYLGAGRDILRFAEENSGKATAPLVIADPDFELQINNGETSCKPMNELEVSRSQWRCSRSLNDGKLCFSRLHGTRKEGERIAAMLGVPPWLGGSVLESRLKSCSSPFILHLATHGFFLSDQQYDPDQEVRYFEQTEGQSDDRLSRTIGPGWENPLLRSGLALAGAETWRRGGNLPAEAEDGILTAEDVSGLNLLGTELAVLSACDTGLGEVLSGEGVFGLRRAFILAGAKSLVMTLWRVPDEPTAKLMQKFYGELLKGRPRAEALRTAKLAMRAKYPDPYFWGAFIIEGNPNPLPRYPITGS